MKKINGKMRGDNMTLVIEDKKYSKKLTAKEAEKISNKIELFNKKPTAKLRDEIIALMSPIATKVKKEAEKKAVAKKAVKKKITKEVKKEAKKEEKKQNLLDEIKEKVANGTLTDEDKAGLASLASSINDLIGKSKSVQEPKPTVGTYRSGESYR